MPRPITARCFSKKCRHGICATAIWLKRLTHWSRISVGEAVARTLPSGSTIHISATLARRQYQFDALLHSAQTRAVKPLEPTEEWETGELPETFPFAV